MRLFVGAGRAGLDQLKTLGVVDITDSFCWNLPFGFVQTGPSAMRPTFDRSLTAPPILKAAVRERCGSMSAIRDARLT